MFTIERPKRDPQFDLTGFVSCFLNVNEPLEPQLAALFTRIFHQDLRVGYLHVSNETWLHLQELTIGPLDLEKDPTMLSSGIHGHLWGASVVINPWIGATVFAYPQNL